MKSIHKQLLWGFVLLVAILIVLAVATGNATAVATPASSVCMDVAESCSGEFGCGEVEDIIYCSSGIVVWISSECGVMEAHHRGGCFPPATLAEMLAK